MMVAAFLIELLCCFDYMLLLGYESIATTSGRTRFWFFLKSKTETCFKKLSTTKSHTRKTL